MRCEPHDCEMEWIETGPGKSKLACPKCFAGERVQEQHNRLDVPLVKFAQNFWRDRPYTTRERTTPYGKARKRND